MTNEQAIKLLHRLQDEQFDGIHGDERREALEMAVRALSGDGDLISRKQVLNASHFVACWDGVEHFSLEVVDANFIQKLPSVQPTQSNAQPTQTNADSTQCNTLDCVSRQAAIVTAVRAAIDWHRLANPQYSIAYCIGEAMRQLPSAQPHWIPCSERLPERGTSILMASRQGWVAEGEYKGVLDGRHLWIEYRWSASLTNDEIIAWMPLPKPYGGESDGDN